MLKTYFKIAVRNILRNKLYTAVSVFGLALGLAVCILALHYLKHELSYDKFADADRIFEVVNVQDFGRHPSKQAGTPPGLASAMREDIPGMETSTAFMIRNLPIKLPNSDVISGKFCVTDSAFCSIFSIQFLEGNAGSCLRGPNSVVVTQELAKEIFGQHDPIGKNLIINGHVCVVTAIVRNLPRATSFSFDGILSDRNTNYYPFDNKLSWMTFADILTFIKVSRSADLVHISSELPAFIKATGGTPDYNKLELLPLRKVHFATYLSPELSTYESQYLYIFSAVALLVLAVSVFNFVGINVTIFSRRVKEIGIRKVTGATNRDLAAQFTIENLILTSISFVLSICFAELAFRWFDSVMGVNYMYGPPFLNSGVLILLLSVMLFDVGVSVYVVRFFGAVKAGLLIQGETGKLRMKTWVRKALVAGQFTISVFLITCTLVVLTQMDFISRKNLGFNKHNVMLIDNAGTPREAEVLKNTLSENSNVVDVSEARWVMTEGSYLGISLDFDNGKPPITLHFVDVDQNFIPTLGLELVKGRNFNALIPSDSGAAIVNEETIRELNITDPFRDSVRFGPQVFKVIGVVKDFNYSSLRNHVEPFVLEFGRADPTSLAVRVREGKTSDVLRYLQASWKKIDPNNDLKYSFLDKDLNKFYVNDDRMYEALVSGSLVAILISLMGIFALSSFLIETKTKEIAVRKVLGSSVARIIGLLSMEFLLLVIISNLLAWPAAYLIMNGWLQNFAYRTRLDLMIFPLVGFVLICLAFSTVVFRVSKAARANPVNNLRYE